MEFEFLLYDVTSTYFEGKMDGNPKARRGYSRDQRPDCKQVNIGLVVTPEGLPIGYEVFAGNTADVTTVEDMVAMMEAKYGVARRIWVMDRGMISEDNLDFLRQRGARYLVGTPKSQLRVFEAALLERQSRYCSPSPPSGWVTSLASMPSCTCVQSASSSARREKELAMLELQRQRLRAQLDKSHASLQRRPAKDPGAIERRLGRWLGRFPAAERLVQVIVERDAAGHACGLQITERAERTQWAAHAHGACLLRTHCPEQDPARLWRWYLQLTQAEDALRISKSDLSLRPVFHHKDERVEAHILVCFLSLALWRVLEMWMRGKGLGTCARQLLKEVASVERSRHRAQHGRGAAGQNRRLCRVPGGAPAGGVPPRSPWPNCSITYLQSVRRAAVSDATFVAQESGGTVARRTALQSQPSHSRVVVAWRADEF